MPASPPNSPAFLALDLEFNQPSKKIIQVGVAIGSASQEESLWAVRQWVLAPGEPIAPNITALTGISDQDVADKAVPLSQLAAELSALIEAHKPFVNPVTWGGGDSQALLSAFKHQDLSFPYFGRRWVDVKTWHALLALARQQNCSGGLRSVMARYGLQFSGPPHRADVDAFNTLRLFFKMLERQRLLEELAMMAKRT